MNCIGGPISPRKPRWQRPLPEVLGVVVVVLLFAGLEQSSLGQVPEVQRKRSESKVNRLLDDLDANYKLHPFRDPWARVLKEVVDLGPRFAIRALGLNAWQVADERWNTLEKEVVTTEPLKLGRPASGLLLHFDEKAKQFVVTKPAVFLFNTREGAHGVLLIGMEVLDTNMKDRIGKPIKGDPFMDPVGFRKGRRFGYRLFEGAEEAFVK